MKIQVINWIEWDEVYSEYKVIGGMGGCVRGHQWDELMVFIDKAERPYYEALGAAIVKLDITEGGFWHQAVGVPVFNDATVGMFSMRAWGDVMAAAWNSQLATRRFTYCDFAWTGLDYLPYRLDEKGCPY